jgi:hypothetical protein
MAADSAIPAARTSTLIRMEKMSHNKKYKKNTGPPNGSITHYNGKTNSAQEKN